MCDANCQCPRCMIIGPKPGAPLEVERYNGPCLMCGGKGEYPVYKLNVIGGVMGANTREVAYIQKCHCKEGKDGDS